MANLKVQNVEGGVVFAAKIVAGSSKTAIAGLLEGVLKIKISAAPEKGKANKCLVEFLAQKIGVKKKCVSIISGQTSPVKNIQVMGIAIKTLAEKLGIDKEKISSDE